MKIKGLLLKDVYELWAQSKVLLILIAVYLLVPALTGGNAMLGSVALLLLAMLPASALGYDERCKWERYARAMPVRRRDLVVSKFLLGAIAVACGAAVQALDAAAMAIKNVLGLICDPVAGLVECPCIKRNALGAVNAMICADMALAGVTSLIPFDEVVATMLAVGRDIRPEYRETAKGGLAVTPFGQSVKEKMLKGEL